MRELLARRQSLGSDEYGSHARLFEILMFTDDPILLIVGADRVVRALKVWHRLWGPTGANFEYAKAHKWQAGVRAIWAGAGVSAALGIAWTPRSKIVTAVAQLARAAKGEAPREEWRSMMGLLEHVRGVAGIRKRTLNVLWATLNSGADSTSTEAEPCELIEPQGTAIAALAHIEASLLASPCVSLLTFVKPDDVYSHESSLDEYRFQSDAAVEPDVDYVEMGGVYYGFYWYLALQAPLSVPVAELMAIGIEVILFGRLAQRAPRIGIESDALASVRALVNGLSDSHAMQTVLDVLLETREWRQLTAHPERVRICHIFGEGNPLADSASRGRFGLLEKLYRKLGMRAQRVELSDAAMSFVTSVLGRLNIHGRVVVGRTCDPAEAGGTAIRFVISNAAEEQEATRPGGMLHGQAKRAKPASMEEEEAPIDARVTTRGVPDASTLTRSRDVEETDEVDRRGNAQTPAASSSHARANLDDITPEEARPSAIERIGPKDRAEIDEKIAATRAELEAGEEIVSKRWDSPAAAEAMEAAADAMGRYELLIPEEELAEASTTSWSRVGSRRANNVRAALVAAHEVRDDLRERLEKSIRSSNRKQTVQDKYREMRCQERATRAAKMAREILTDDSEYSLHFESDEDATEAILEFVIALDERNSDGTVRVEASNMKHWVAFCEARHTAIVRRRPWMPGDAVAVNENFVVCQAFLFIYANMHSRAGSTLPPRPSSAVNVLRGVKRFHTRLGLPFPDLTDVIQLAIAQTKKYVKDHCNNGLLPLRAEPYLPEEIVNILAVEDGEKIGSYEFQSSSRTGVSLKAAIAVLAQAGFRGAEVALAAGKEFGKDCINRASILWFIKGKVVLDPTEEQLRGLTVDDFALIIPPPSKADQFGIQWGNHPIYCRWHPTNKICAARELQKLELHTPVHGEQRQRTPLFADDKGNMFSRRWLADAVKGMLQATGVDEKRLKGLTLHSFRRYLACALLAKDVDPHTICALLRWRSTKSLAAYANIGRVKYANLIDQASSATVDSIRTAHVTRHLVLDPEDVLRELVGQGMNLAAQRAGQDGDMPDEQDRADALMEDE